MDRVLKKTFYWIPVFIWMIVIFYFSSRARISLSEEETINFLIFKTLHIIEYAILYFLLFRAFFLSANKHSSSKIYWYPFFIALIYAASDEFHQLLVPTRDGALRDVFIDALGIAFMYTLIKKSKKIAKKIV
ncbi:MAG: VanZ family protein [Candidatus Roizmanbacteria bacterium]|nr:MAG: VanZ family protein [Candidatus Roizmanbacteria bacterium]